MQRAVNVGLKVALGFCVRNSEGACVQGRGRAILSSRGGPIFSSCNYVSNGGR